ncbi:MAG TPA: hypothetical protein VGD67_09230 [Pseudonocardiaceae bacterium]
MTAGLTLALAAAAVLICLGGLLGSSWTAQALTTVSRRHAAERRNLDNGWRDLAMARRASGPVRCARCERTITDTSWLLVVDPPLDEEDDGT